MPAGTKVTKEEVEKVAAMKAANPKASLENIARAIGRAESTISEIQKRDEYAKYMEKQKKVIDQLRIAAMIKADASLIDDIETMKPWEKVGLSKTFYEQVYGLPDAKGGITVQGEKVMIVPSELVDKYAISHDTEGSSS